MSAIRMVQLESALVVLMDDIAGMEPEHAGRFVVTGSHGGLGSARRAIQHPPRAVVFSDAGVGKDAAGTAGLDLLAQFGIPAATVAVDSARIGDAEDTLEHGRISYANPAGIELGLAPGRGVKEAIAAIALRQKT